ncbi:hypothetical protein LTR70_004444 [Exophiala xenobiotica]|nr:hypothetical protein LTR70_004444 [Exophiala xenobiotica]
MLLKAFLLFGVLAALTSTAIARHPRIEFCDHKGSDACITEQMEIGVCKALPDSNNKGDGGSTFEFIDVPSDVQCAFHEDNDGCNDEYVEWATGSGQIPKYWWGQRHYYRHYICFRSTKELPAYKKLPP